MRDAYRRRARICSPRSGTARLLLYRSRRSSGEQLQLQRLYTDQSEKTDQSDDNDEKVLLNK
jgi:hypothetical protein